MDGGGERENGEGTGSSSGEAGRGSPSLLEAMEAAVLGAVGVTCRVMRVFRRQVSTGPLVS